jgi:hypothetical protein
VARVDPASFQLVPVPKDEPPPCKEFHGWHYGIFYGLNVTRQISRSGHKFGRKETPSYGTHFARIPGTIIMPDLTNMPREALTA